MLATIQASVTHNNVLGMSQCYYNHVPTVFFLLLQAQCIHSVIQQTIDSSTTQHACHSGQHHVVCVQLLLLTSRAVRLESSPYRFNKLFPNKRAHNNGGTWPFDSITHWLLNRNVVGSGSGRNGARTHACTRTHMRGQASAYIHRRRHTQKYIEIDVSIHTHTHIYIYIYIQSVPGGMCQTSGGCSLC